VTSYHKLYFMSFTFYNISATLGNKQLIDCVTSVCKHDSHQWTWAKRSTCYWCL